MHNLRNQLQVVEDYDMYLPEDAYNIKMNLVAD